MHMLQIAWTLKAPGLHTRIFVLIMLSLIFVSSPLSADQREENIDMYLVLDKSLSMVEEIEPVREYVKNNLVERLLIPGDYLTIIIFYGEAHRFLSHQITQNPDAVQQEIDTVLADGRFTDIGNALDLLNTTVNQTTDRELRKYLLLITDGIQEAPPDSKYFSPDGSFNHFFLENTKTIQRQGWKIQILGLGTASAARQIAKELSATYDEIASVSEPTPVETDGQKMPQGDAVATRQSSASSSESITDQLAEATSEFTARIDVIEEIDSMVLNSDGNGKVRLGLQPFGYTENITVVISSCRIEYDSVRSGNVLPNPISISLSPDTDTVVTIPIHLQKVPNPGEFSAEFVFNFDGEYTFSPSRMAGKLKIQESMHKIWIFAGVAFILIVAVTAFILFRAKGSQKESDGYETTLS